VQTARQSSAQKSGPSICGTFALEVALVAMNPEEALGEFDRLLDEADVLRQLRPSSDSDQRAAPVLLHLRFARHPPCNMIGGIDLADKATQEN
jgi:hypothetical protein